MISGEYVGRTYPPTDPYLVTRGKIAEFARALNDPDPAFTGPHPMAPPTFMAMICSAAVGAFFNDPDLGVQLGRTYQVEQRLRWQRPLRAGDEVRAQLSISKVQPQAAADLITLAVEVTTMSGEVIGVGESDFYHAREVA